MTTEITIQQRAVIAIGGSQYETDLRALAAASSEITAITNKAGLAQCHVSRMNLKRERLEIGKKASAATEDAKLFVAAVSSRAKSLVALLAPEESRLGDLQDGYTAEQDRIKREAAHREQERVEAITARIQSIREYPITAATSSIEGCERFMQALLEISVDDSYAEFQGRAAVALADAKAGVAAILAAKQAAAEEAARIKAEQEAAASKHASEVAEFNRQKEFADEQLRNKQAKAKADQDERERMYAEARKIEEDRIAAERAALAADRAKIDAELAARQAAFDVEQKLSRDAEEQRRAVKEAAEKQLSDAAEAEKRKEDEAEAARRSATSDIRQQIDKALDALDDWQLRNVLQYAIECMPEISTGIPTKHQINGRRPRAILPEREEKPAATQREGRK